MPPYLNGEPIAMEGALPLGMTEAPEFSVMRFQLNVGDRLVLLSDGIVEATNANGQLFGFDRVHSLLRSAATAAAIAAALNPSASRRHQRHLRHRSAVPTPPRIIRNKSPMRDNGAVSSRSFPFPRNWGWGADKAYLPPNRRSTSATCELLELLAHHITVSPVLFWHWGWRR